MVFGLQTIHPKWLFNKPLCLGFEHILKSTDSFVGKRFVDLLNDRYDMDIPIINNSIQDQAAVGVGSALGVDGEICGMHSSNKLAEAAVGLLVRTKNKVAVNPFPEGI